MARKISLTEHECLHRNPREDYWIPPGTPPGTPTGKVPSKLKCYPTREIPDEYFRQFWEIPDGYLRTSPRTPPGTPPGTIPGSRPTKINIYPTMEIPPENYWTPPGTPPKTPPGSIPIKRGHHPTWEVPLRRKLRKKGKKDPYFYVDTEKEELCSFSSGETTTENSFSVLADQTTATEKEESQERSGSRKDCLVNTTEERRPFILTCIFDKFKNYMYNAFDCNPVKTGINKCIMYAYNNKNEVYSGYFPEPIYLESDDFNKTNELNAYKYPSFYFGKPIRQITNTFSRFNDKYFSKMRHAYKISQYIYNRKSTSSSKGTIDTSIGIKRKWHIVDNKRNSRKHDRKPGYQNPELPNNQKNSKTSGRNSSGSGSSSSNNINYYNNKDPLETAPRNVTTARGVAEYTATPKGGYTPTVTLRNSAEYTADIPNNRRKNPYGEYTLKDTQRTTTLRDLAEYTADIPKYGIGNPNREHADNPREEYTSIAISKNLGGYTATPEGEYTPTATPRDSAEYTADTHHHMMENPNGEYTPKDSQRRMYTQKRGQSIYDQRPKWQNNNNNNNNNNNLKYYNQNNSSKNPESYSSKFSYNNKKK